MDADHASAFYGLFAYGIKLDVQPGRSLFDLLNRQIGISETYLNERVQTVFLNGRSVDDLTVENVADGAIIALSAAMPGLAGAIFRKNAVLSSMRSVSKNQIEYASDITSLSVYPDQYPGHVTLKLFNLIASDLGPGFLKRGVRMNGDDVRRYLEGKMTYIGTFCRSLTVDGEPHAIDALDNLCTGNGGIFLSIDFL